MMKVWNSPIVEELAVKATQYDPNGGTKADGQYISMDGKYSYYTYGPSSGSNGVPETNVKPE